jgi:DNA repair protein RecO (recombination protein O)
MKDTTKALVLGKLAVGEKGHVLRLWTRKYGPQAYIIHSIRSNKNGIRPAVLLPMTFLNATVDHKNNGGLEKIKEVEVTKIWDRLTTNHIRQTLCFFSAEVLQKTLQEGDASPAFFDEFMAVLERWDTSNVNLAMSSNELLLLVWKHLGFNINTEYYENDFVLDLREGVFVSNVPTNSDFLSPETSKELVDWIRDKNKLVSKIGRLEITNGLVLGLKWHYPSLGKINSLEILRSISF